MSSEEFRRAIESRNTQKVKAFLDANPSLYANQTLGTVTALHIACLNNRHEIVSLLLARPEVDVNKKNSKMDTPLITICIYKSCEALRVLLKDPRVNVNMADRMGRTPLWQVSWRGYDMMIKWMIILRGRDLDVEKEGDERGKKYTALQIAHKCGDKNTYSLLERFVKNPAQTRHELGLEFDVPDAMSVELFAMTVFLCDGYLRIKTTNNSVSERFFRIICRLPMELQMIICCRVYGPSKDNILSRDSEVAFRHLAKVFK